MTKDRHKKQYGGLFKNYFFEMLVEKDVLY